MKYKFNLDRSQLIVSADELERALLREMPAEEIQSDAALWDFLEQLVCNSELEWIRPEETGDLTDAPLLGIRESDESISERWGFMPYALRSPLIDLRDKGEAVFSNSW